MSAESKQWLGILKGVSRSFYLSLRLLPAPMRSAAVLAYLLARAADTVADTTLLPVALRRKSLRGLQEMIDSGRAWEMDLSGFEGTGALPAEQELLGHLPAIWESCRQMPEDEFQLIQDVVRTIIGGQSLDLDRFANAGRERVIPLESDEELVDYTYRVAGCVGEFWTKLGILTLGGGFSKCDAARLAGWGRDYGMGLQLVNILRDLPEDLSAGRCYLPVVDPFDRILLMEQHRRWLESARELVSAGLRYADAMAKTRLRVASGLPAEIAVETIDGMSGADWPTLCRRIKIPRSRVYYLLGRQLWHGLIS